MTNQPEFEKALAELRAEAVRLKGEVSTTKKQRWLTWIILAFTVGLPIAYATPYVLANNVIGDGTFSSSIASGSNAFGALTNGARIDFGAGATDYASSNGTTVTFAGPTGSVGGITLGDASTVGTLKTNVGGSVREFATFGGQGQLQLLGTGSDTGAVDVGIVFGQNTALGVLDVMREVRNGNSFSSALIERIAVSGVQTLTPTDQSADCDNAATGNGASGKVCIQAGQGSMVLTNSAITTSSLVFLTNVSDDTTCLSGYATVGTGTVTIGCVGAANATANTVMSFHVMSL